MLLIPPPITCDRLVPLGTIALGIGDCTSSAGTRLPAPPIAMITKASFLAKGKHALGRVATSAGLGRPGGPGAWSTARRAAWGADLHDWVS
jgi:hypothetical protein